MTTLLNNIIYYDIDYYDDSYKIPQQQYESKFTIFYKLWYWIHGSRM